MERQNKRNREFIRVCKPLDNQAQGHLQWWERNLHKVKQVFAGTEKMTIGSDIQRNMEGGRKAFRSGVTISTSLLHAAAST